MSEIRLIHLHQKVQS